MELERTPSLVQLQVRPPVMHNDLHLINQAESPFFLTALLLVLPFVNPPMHPHLFEPWRREPPRKAVLPHPQPDLRQRKPTASPFRMHRIVGLAIVPYPHGGIEKNSPCARGGIVGVDEAALGTFDVRGCETVRNTTKLEALDTRKGRDRHGDCASVRTWAGFGDRMRGAGQTYAIPAAGYGNRLAMGNGFPRLGRAEVRPCLRGVLVPARVAQGERVIEEGRLAKVE